MQKSPVKRRHWRLQAVIGTRVVEAGECGEKFVGEQHLPSHSFDFFAAQRGRSWRARASPFEVLKKKFLAAQVFHSTNFYQG